jgi:hypothetical protein
MIAATFTPDSEPFTLWPKSGTGAGQVILLIGVFVFLTLVIFAWAAFWRKPRSRKHSYHGSSDLENGGLPQRHKRRSALSRALFGRKRRRRRRSQGRERPVNPTLSQVGGLPPRRDEQRPPS